MNNWNISVCGLNCARCDLHEQNECKGCRGTQDKHWSPNCKLLACADSKGLKYCFECEELPCEILRSFASDAHDHHRITVENLLKMKKLGLQEWIKQQDKVMFCPGWII
ncbi:DUF3795 domain-containing protein [Candidatus Cloacimonadota bacterium]